MSGRKATAVTALQSALLLLTALAGAQAAFPSHAHQSGAFNGVTTTFKLLNATLRREQDLKVRFTLHNGSDRPVTFRYANLLEHVDVFTAQGERVKLRNNAPTRESPAWSIPLKPGERFEKIERISLFTDYDLAPGDYYLIFRYDLRLLSDDVLKAYRKKLDSSDLVDWDKAQYWFHIHK